MVLWDRKIHWQFGGNVQPVRMVCQVDWKSCPSTILNYLWSEIVTDVIDYVTVNDGLLWRVMTITFCLLIILYTLWTKIMETIQDVMKEQIFNGINFKLQNLEMRVNVLAYRMQYGTWPLPHNIDTNSAIIKAEDNQSMASFNLGNDYPWLLSKLIPKYILKSKNVKFHPSKSSSGNETPSGIYEEKSIAQTTHSKRKLRKKCVKCIQSNKRVNIKCHASQKRQSMEIHCNELSNDKGRIEIPRKFLSNSPKITKLFRSTKITLAKVRQRLESLHTVLKFYESGEGINYATNVNLLDSFLQELSDLQSGTESDEYRMKNIAEDLKLLQSNVCISDYNENVNQSLQIADSTQCKDQDSEIQSSLLPMDPANEPPLALHEIDVIEIDNSSNSENNHEDEINMKCAEGDVLIASSKNCYSLQILDSIVEEQSGNSCNEQPINSDLSDDQEIESNPVSDEYVNIDTNCEDEKHHSPNGDSIDCREVIAIEEISENIFPVLSFEEFDGILTNKSDSEERKDVEIIGEMMLEIRGNKLMREEEFSEVHASHGIMNNIIICSTTSAEESLTNNSIIESDSCCSAFMKLEKIKFDALTEVEKIWTDKLLMDEHLKYNEPLILKNWFTNAGINFSINVSSDEFSERMTRLKDIVGTKELEYSGKSNDSMGNEHKPELQLVDSSTKLPHKLNLLLNVSSTDRISKSVIERPKSHDIRNNNLNPSCLKPRVSKFNLSRSNTDLIPRKSKLHGISTQYERSPKRSNTPQISSDSINRRCTIKAQHRSSSLDSIWKENCHKTKSKSGIPVLKTRYLEEPRNPNYRYNSPRRGSLPMSTKPQMSAKFLDHMPSKESTCSSKKRNHKDHHSEEQTIVYINIINEQRDHSMKMENPHEFSDYVKENIYKIRGLTEYIKNSGVSKIVTIVCSTTSQNTEDESKDIEIVPHRKFVIDTSTLV